MSLGFLLIYGRLLHFHITYFFFFLRNRLFIWKNFSYFDFSQLLLFGAICFLQHPYIHQYFFSTGDQIRSLSSSFCVCGKHIPVQCCVLLTVLYSRHTLFESSTLVMLRLIWGVRWCRHHSSFHFIFPINLSPNAISTY